MSVPATKQILGAIAFAAFAVRWSFDWKQDGWFGHGFTIFSIIFAAISLSAAIYEIANQ